MNYLATHGVRSSLSFFAALALLLGLSSCTDSLTDVDTGQLGPNEGVELSKGGQPGKGGGKGSTADFDQLLEGALAGQDSVQIAADNKKNLETASPTFELGFNFALTAAQSVVDVQEDGRSVDEILADGDQECAFDCPDLEACAAAEGGRAGMIERLQTALTRTEPRSLGIRIEISKEDVNTQHTNHFVSVRDNTGPSDAAAGYPHLNLGRNHQPQNFLLVEYSGADIDDQTVARELTLSLGTIRIWERVGVAASGKLSCNNLDTIVATIAPLGG